MTPGQIAFVVLVTVTAVVHIVLLFHRGYIMDKLGRKQDEHSKQIDAINQRVKDVEKAMTEGGALYFPHKLSKVKP